MTNHPGSAAPAAPISRNHPCPCGSGKRYKHCCGAAAETGLQSPGESGLADTLRKALQNQLAGKFSQAEQLYRAALELDANNIDALHMLGVVCMERFRHAEALDLLYRAAELTHWAQPQIFHNLGLVIARLSTRDANARQDLLLAKQLERRKQPASNAKSSVMPLVSVILYSYNQARYIAGALASVFEQSYQNLELIVVDDGSADGSPAIIGELLEQGPFPRRFIERAAPGAEIALDQAAELAQGDFLAFLNAEDCYAPDRIEQMVAQIAAKRAQWGYSGIALIGPHGETMDSTHPAAQRLLRPPGNAFDRISNSFSFLEFNPCIASGNLFVERSLFRRAGGFGARGFGQERDFLLRAATLSEPVWVEAPLYRHRLHEESSIGESQEKISADAAKWLADFYRSLEIITTVANELSPHHPDNRTLVYKLGLNAGHGKFLPADRLRALSRQWLAKPSSRISRSTTLSESRAEGRKQALVVLGMHRSGTSAFSRVLNLCGAFLPDNRHPAKLGDNEKGFWEPEEIPQLNERLFKSIGTTWLNEKLNLADWNHLHADFAEDAAALLETEYGNQTLILIKDPRICLLAAWWDEVLHVSGYEPLYVIPLRNPLEVAASLHVRDRLPMETGLALWLRYFDEAEAVTRDSRRVFVAYADLVADWKRCVNKISAAVDVKLDIGKNGQEVESFLEDRLRRQKATDESLFDLPPTPVNQAIKEKYRWALQQAGLS